MKLYEVFDSINPPQELRRVFDEVEVLKLSASRHSGGVTVHIESERLLTYQTVRHMEKVLNEQFFKGIDKSAVLAEHYKLSAQYTPESVWEHYNESVREELGAVSRLNASFLNRAEVYVNGTELRLKSEDTFINRHIGEEVKSCIEELFLSRFEIPLRVINEFYETKKPEEESGDTLSRPAYEFYTKEKLRSMGVMSAKNEEETGEADNVADGDNKALKEGAEGSSAGEDVTNVQNVTGQAGPDGAQSGQSSDGSGQAGQRKTSGSKKDTKSGDKGGKADFKKFERNGNYTPKKKIPEDPEIFYGKPFDGELSPISDVDDGFGDYVIRGKIIKFEERELRNEKLLFMFQITDFTNSIGAKIFARKEEADELRGKLKPGKFVLLKGQVMFDTYEKEVSVGVIYGMKNIKDFTKKRMDTAERKRIELHAHTKMSDMDAVVDPSVLVKTAFEWGMPGIAITDHGVVQAFPEANHAIDKKKYKDDPEMYKRAEEFKIIYGVEAYLVDDILEPVRDSKGQSLDSGFVVFDIETTGFGAERDRIIEIGAVKVENGKITDRYSTFVNPKVPIPPRIEELTGIKDSMVMDSPEIDVILPEFLAFCEGCTLVAHNASFDTGFIRANAERLGLPYDFTVVDTVGLARALLPGLSRFKLDTVARELGVSLENHHRAVDDAKATADIFVKFLERLRERKVVSLDEVNEVCKPTPEMIKKMPTYHAIILCQNETGRINLYRLVSLSHIEYYARRPRIPKSIFLENREGLIIGSACEAGELYQAILRESPQNEIERLCEFYDYYEIQPLGNNQFMIADEKHENIKSEEDLIAINKKIIALGEQYNKPVAATCDVHFLNPEDEVYRRIIMSCKGFADADNQAPLYLRTTEEMLEEFSYLGREKAEEVVLDNPQKIADMIGKVSPIHPDKCPPVIEDSDKTLRKICYDKAHSMYGEKLPEIVENRLEHELTSIINNGFAVMYIIAQKLVWKSNEDGYLVGSRGSVGSSFVATMSGITEVNPLPAHYYCTECFFSDFDSEEVKDCQKRGLSGCDMPDRVCPNCGKPLIKDGHDIPFETFLGFYGDKEPDIDLNFSGEYQAKAHDYTEVIFGKGQTFRAGTIATLAEKTAYGYVLKYNEEHGVVMRKAEIERISSGCVGVRRSTGQHPGGIIVLPIGHEIYKFTPVQRPANDMTTKTVTTHFDYHSIDHNLLKLDILGHDDPTMIRRLEDLTGVDAKQIPLDDKKVISLFSSTEALGITPDDIGGCDLGSLGLPELGTPFVMQMLRDTKPQSFSDMIRISGLSHGTDVWLNNTQLLIQEGKCTLSNAICTRDDIMVFLIYQGVENGLAFKIMESVRKGKGLTPEMEEAMIAQGIPDWYIWSCKQIKYMFPKAHACAYVMMAFRVAHFKIYYPLAYYAAFFGIRAKAFSYETMCLGKEVLERNMKEIKKKMDTKTASPKDEDSYNDMKIVQEMYARGFDFMPIDLFKAKAHAFQIIDGKLMPSFDSIDGVGETAAEQIEEAAKDGPFLSQDDFRTRCKISQTIADQMADLGLLGDIPKSNQMSLLDLFLL